MISNRCSTYRLQLYHLQSESPPDLEDGMLAKELIALIVETVFYFAHLGSFVWSVEPIS